MNSLRLKCINDCFRRVLPFRYDNLGGDGLQPCLATPIVCMSVYGTEHYPPKRRSDRLLGLMHQPHFRDELPRCLENFPTWQLAEGSSATFNCLTVPFKQTEDWKQYSMRPITYEQTHQWHVTIEPLEQQTVGRFRM